MPKDFYAVLAVPRNASESQLRERFRQLARERHPDRFRGEEKARAERDFQEITQAFNVLVDSDRRRQHDLELAQPQEPQLADGKAAARVYLQRGIRSYRDKNFAAAVDNFDRAVTADRTSAQAWHHLALAASQIEGQSERAAIAIERACQLEPMNPSYLKLAGRLFAVEGETEKAETYYRSALEWGADDPAIHEALTGLGRGGRRGFFGRGG